MFNSTQEEIIGKINSLTFEEKMVLLNGISLPAALLLQKIFPADPFITWFADTKKETTHR